jgi:hypothetical protein
MSTSGSPLVCEVHTTLIDVEIVDRRCRPYRTASGRLRPYFAFCFAPEAHLVMSFALGLDPPDQRSLVTLLYTAIMHSPEKPYGGIPDEIWLYSQISFALPIQHELATLGIALRTLSLEPHPAGAAERFLGTLDEEFWQTMPGYLSAYGTVPENGTENLSLRQMESALRLYLAYYHRTVNSETGQSPLAFWKDHCSPRQADPFMLATIRRVGNARIVTSKGMYYRRWKDWHDPL